MRTALFILAIAMTAVPRIVAAEPLKVFLFTKETPDGSVDEQLKGRQDSLRDLTKAFSDGKYQTTFTLVQSRDRADLIVELLSRGEITRSASSSSTRSVGGGTASASHTASETKRHLTVLISIGQFTTELTTEGQLPWDEMAENAARDIAKWAAENEQQVKKALAK